ncbi:hypothetical protein BDV09DRAFT_55602 [Aspergillus tetrazonus]
MSCSRSSKPSRGLQRCAGVYVTSAVVLRTGSINRYPSQKGLFLKDFLASLCCESRIRSHKHREYHLIPSHPTLTSRARKG